MACFIVHHEHAPDEYRIAFAARAGVDSPLRHTATVGSCLYGDHEIWWRIEAENEP